MEGVTRIELVLKEPQSFALPLGYTPYKQMASARGLEPLRQQNRPKSLANSPLHQLGYADNKNAL